LKSEIERHEWLDVLRFCAALSVVASHVRGTLFEEFGALEPASQTTITAIFFAVTRLGHEAVIVFFALSGYLVGGKVIARLVDGDFSPTAYAVDRITRIWLPLTPALVLSGLLAPGSESPKVWVGNLVGLQGVLVPNLGGNAPLWSLAYEIWFYVLAYAAGRQALRKGIDIPALALAVAGALVFTRLEVKYLACWLIGSLFYVRPHVLPARSSLGVAAVLSAAAVAGLQVSNAGYMQVVASGKGIQALLEMALSIGVSLACVTFSRMRPTKIALWFGPLAAFSYTLYLIHYPLLGLFELFGWTRLTTIDARALALFVASMLAMIFAAWMMYLPFERQTARARRAIRAIVAQ